MKDSTLRLIVSLVGQGAAAGIMACSILALNAMDPSELPSERAVVMFATFCVGLVSFAALHIAGCVRGSGIDHVDCRALFH